MPSFEVDFEVYCSCGKGLCRNADTSSGYKGLSVTVSPCEDCLKAEYDKGYNDGQETTEE